MYAAPGSAEPLLPAASGFAIASADASGAAGRGRDRDRSYRQGGGERDIDDDDAHGGPMRAVPHHYHGAGSTSSGHSMAHHSPTRQEYRLVHAAEQRSPNDGSGGDVDVDNDSDVAPGRHLMSGVPSPMRLGNSVGAPSDSRKLPYSQSRLLSVDMFRGFIMMLMAWDHTKDFWSDGKYVFGSERWDGAYATYQNNGGVFFARIISHFCAPGFFFTMGIGMALFHASRIKRGWPAGAVVRHFAIRGAILILADRVVNLALYAQLVRPSSWGHNRWNLDTPRWAFGLVSVFEVLTCLGLTMMVVGALLPALAYARKWRIGPVPVAYIAASALFLGNMAASNVAIVHYQHGDPDNGTSSFPHSGVSADTFVEFLVRFFLIPGQYQYGSFAYPVIPWMGLTCLGLIAGWELATEKGRDRLGLLCLIRGILLLIVFVFLRAFGGEVGNYRGRPRDDDLQHVNPVIAFLDLCKYPPDPVYVCWTLGVCLLVLAAFEALCRHYDSIRRRRLLAVAVQDHDLDGLESPALNEDRHRQYRYGYVELLMFPRPLRRVTRPLLVFGRVPLFFYMFQWLALGASGAILHSFSSGLQLPLCVLPWIALLCIAYPLCLLYASFKDKQSGDSLWRLF